MSNVANQLGQDPTLPDVSLVLGGKTYKLCFDFNAVCAAEKETGVNLLAAALSEITAQSLRGLLWASMLKDRPDITVDEVGDMIRLSNISTIRSAITTAWFGSVPNADADAGTTTGEDQAQSE